MVPFQVQQVVGRLASPVHGVSRKEAAHVPLNLSQSSQRGRETQGELRTPYASNPAESRAHQQHIVQQSHAVILANGQPVLVPLDYHHHQQQQQHFQPNDVASAAIAASPAAYTKAMDVGACLPERAVVELPPQQGQQQPPGTFPQAPLLAPSGPSHFMKGAIIQLATGELKRVEDLQTQDFMRSAEVSGGLKIDSSMVVDIRSSQQRPGLVALHFNVGEQQSKVTIDVPPEHPFFVFGQGWSSCSPERTAQLYGLTCHHLQVGDVCVSVTLQQQAASQQKPPQQVQARTPTKVNSTSGAPPQPMGPPAPQQHPSATKPIKNGAYPSREGPGQGGAHAGRGFATCRRAPKDRTGLQQSTLGARETYLFAHWGSCSTGNRSGSLFRRGIPEALVCPWLPKITTSNTRREGV